MKNSDYKSRIIEAVSRIDDEALLRRLYKLIQIIFRIDNEWILKQFDKFVENIQK